jgi:molybdopterin converting factor small subunit
MASPQSITVRVSAPLREYCGGAPELRVAAATVRAVLAELERSHLPLYRSVCDDTGSVRRHVNVFVNDHRLAGPGALDTPLAAGDQVTILPAVSGG